MKKRMLALLLSSALSVSFLTGCGNDVPSAEKLIDAQTVPKKYEGTVDYDVSSVVSMRSTTAAADGITADEKNALFSVTRDVSLSLYADELEYAEISEKSSFAGVEQTTYEMKWNDLKNGARYICADDSNEWTMQTDEKDGKETTSAMTAVETMTSLLSYTTEADGYALEKSGDIWTADTAVPVADIVKEHPDLMEYLGDLTGELSDSDANDEENDTDTEEITVDDTEVTENVQTTETSTVTPKGNVNVSLKFEKDTNRVSDIHVTLDDAAYEYLDDTLSDLNFEMEECDIKIAVAYHDGDTMSIPDDVTKSAKENIGNTSDDSEDTGTIAEEILSTSEMTPEQVAADMSLSEDFLISDTTFYLSDGTELVISNEDIVQELSDLMSWYSEMELYDLIETNEVDEAGSIEYYAKMYTAIDILCQLGYADTDLHDYLSQALSEHYLLLTMEVIQNADAPFFSTENPENVENSEEAQE